MLRSRIRSFWRSVWRRAEMEENLSDELQFHLERRAEDLVARAGLTPEQAMRTARLEFGSLEKYKEESRQSRGLRILDELGSDLRYAWRSVRKNKGFALAAIATLALGIGANTAVFSVVDAILVRQLPVPDPERLVVFDWLRSPDSMVAGYSGYGRRGPSPTVGIRTSFSSLTFERFRDRTATLSHVFAFSPRTLTISADREADTASALLVTGDYFAGLGVRALHGRTITSSDDAPEAQPVAVISYRYWQRRFGGDAGIVGKAFDVNRVPVVIVGVTPEGFEGVRLTESTDVTLPIVIAPALGNDEALTRAGWRWWMEIMGRLKGGVTREQALADLQNAFAETVRESWAARPPETPNPARSGMPQLRVRPGAQGPDDSRVDAQQILSIVFAVVAAVLLIGCVNLANLLLVRATARRQEVSIRLALGASRWRLIRQMLTENLLLALVGGAAGTVVAVWGKNFMQWLPGNDAPSVDASIDVRALGFALGLSALTALVFGIGPAVRATRTELSPALKIGTPRTSGRRGVAGKSLLGLQVALSVMLVAGAGLLARSLYNFAQVDVGFDADNLLVFRINPSVRNPARAFDLYDRVVAAIEGVPGVRSATLSSMPLVAHSEWEVVVRPDGADRQQDVSFLAVRWNFFDTMGIPVLAGRTLAAADSAGAGPVGVINETMAREVFGEPRPIGRHFQIVRGATRGAAIEVVGVVRDSKYSRLDQSTPPTLFVPHAQVAPGPMIVEVRTGPDPMTLVPSLREAARRVDSSLPLEEVKTQRQQIAETIGKPRAFAVLTAASAIIGLLLACVGLYGIVSYDATRRTTEIGIRLALGATRWDVVRLVARETMIVVGIGGAIGLILVAASSRLVASVLFGVRPSDPATITAAMLVMLAVASLAAAVPARRASRLDPTAALRYE